jgi:hypothetical protein
MRKRLLGFLMLLLCVQFHDAQGADEAPLPAGVTANWNLGQAYHETTPTQERICINGLWQWQPAKAERTQVPKADWGYFKVPGCWPGITDYEQKDCQTVFAHPSWKGESLGTISAAWYQREIEIPASWHDRRIELAVEYLNSQATAFLDGKPLGSITFPGGALDLTAACKPGQTQRLSLLVVALPLKEAILSFQDTNSAREVKGAVARRGLCGDVFLTSAPRTARIISTTAHTSFQRGEISCAAGLQDLGKESYTLAADITRDGHAVHHFTSAPFTSADVKDGRFTFADHWQPAALWDLNSPGNQFELQLTLRAAARPVDVGLPVRFGFREFWIDGRDFYLNGSRIFLSAVPLDNAQIGAAWANYAAAKESFRRLQSFGINFVYTHNYTCQPGTHLGFSEILRAADDVGMLVALTQPHFSDYNWKAADADQRNGYARHAAFYVQAAQNHPAVVAYAMSHNATGYDEDMNPDLIDGLQQRRDTWAQKNADLALRAEAIVKRIDPDRIVYHHSSGNLGAIYSSNFYPNFVPIQELSDWFEHWSTKGVKPMFMCEYGAPFSWDWGMYRGWYQGKRAWGDAVVPWEFCLAEWDAQFLGDAAYRVTEAEKTNLRWEAKQFRQLQGWHRWDEPQNLNSKNFNDRDRVEADYLTRNWQAFRGWEVSAISPWEHDQYWKLRPGVKRDRVELATDWQTLQRPGFSPDYINERYERMDLAYEQADWIPTAAAQSLVRNNRPLLSFIGGKPDKFTSQDHLFYPGEPLDKQLILINNSRATVACECGWSLALPQQIDGVAKQDLPTGAQRRIPLRFKLPDDLPPGNYSLFASVTFRQSDPQLPAETQTSAFAFTVLKKPVQAQRSSKTALWDPLGETAALLASRKVAFERVDEHSALDAYDLLIVGKGALTPGGAAPNLARVAQGLRVLVFEQTGEALEQRLGFRVQAYGLRNGFARVPDHPLLAGLSNDMLRDWRGAATLLPARLKYEEQPMLGPTVLWCGLRVPHLWRCGNAGNVASVLIEKPAGGDFLSLIDGGFSLQYSPLLEHRAGQGVIVFCQMDVTGRTEADPAAETLVGNLLDYLDHWQPTEVRTASYCGESKGREYLSALGVRPAEFDATRLAPKSVLILGPGCAAALQGHRAELTDFLKQHGRILGLGLSSSEAEMLPASVHLKPREYVVSFFEPPHQDSPWRGIGPGELMNRDPRELPLIASGAETLGAGVLGAAADGRILFCQLAPWQFGVATDNLKKTYRRTSVGIARLIGNLGVRSASPLIERFSSPAAAKDQRWLDGLYLDVPAAWDDPYRFFRW